MRLRPRRGGPGCGACPVWVDPRRHGARWHEVSRRVKGHAGPLCPGLQTLPLRAAFTPTGAFGSACFVVFARRSARVFPSPAARLSPSRARLSDPFFRSCERSVPASIPFLRASDRHRVRKPACPHVGPLSRTQTRYSERGQHRPRAEQQAHVRNSKPTCGTASPRAGQQAHVQDSRPTCRTAGPRAGQQAHVRNSKIPRMG